MKTRIAALALCLWLIPTGALASVAELIQPTAGDAAAPTTASEATPAEATASEAASEGEMPEKIRRFIEVAQNEFTQTNWERLPKDNKYTIWFYGDHRQIGWCSVFLIWCANEAGIPLFEMESVEVPQDGVFSCREGRVGNVKLGFESVGRWTETEPPRPGDLLIYGVRGSTPYTHIGMVETVTDLGDDVYELTTIEGNVGATVKRYRFRYDLTPKRAYHNMSEVPQDERTDENCQYKLHDEEWYVFGFCRTWE